VVGVRSPLTGIFGDANGGGFWGAHLRRAGFSAVIIRGRAEKPVYLKIDDQQVSRSKMLPTCGVKTPTRPAMPCRLSLGDKFRIAAIGPAGENLVSIAGIVVDKDHLAARCGVGAVMGSKNLKAIAVRCSKPFPLADPELFKRGGCPLREIWKPTMPA
jgi:aldehyde:ferredoxin oxidoreductase